MNKDTVKGKTNEVVGDARERSGRAVGNDSLEAKGKAQASKGKAQAIVGKLEDKADDVKDKLKSISRG